MIGFIMTMIDDPDDRAFFLDLYQQYKNLMFWAVKQTVDDIDAQNDIVQDAIVKLIRKIETLRTLKPSSLKAYIVMTVRHEAINRQKKAMREQPVENEALAQMKAYSLDGLVRIMDQKALLAKLWQSLSENDRLLLEGKYILELSNEELAQTLGCKPDSVRMLLSRAKRNACAAVERLEHAEI